MLNIIKFDLLTRKQLCNEYLLKKAAITDYAILKGSFVSEYNYANNSVSQKNRIEIYWNKPNFKNNSIFILKKNL